DLAAVERSAWFVAVLLLRHGGTVADEFSENRDRLFAGIVKPINTYAVVGVGVFRDLEHIGRSAVVKFHGQRIRRADIVRDGTTPLSGDVLIVIASALPGTVRHLDALCFQCLLTRRIACLGWPLHTQ